MAYTYGATTNATVVGHGTRKEYEVRLGWQLNSQNVANNTSNISLRLEVRSINSSYYTHGYSQTSTIGSKTFDAAVFDMRSTNVWQIFATRTYDVTHNDDGTYSAERTGSFTTNADADWSLKSGSASVSYTLPTIPRYAAITKHEISNVTQDAITVSWDADKNCSDVMYSLNSAAWVRPAGVGHPTYTIPGLSPGTSYTVKTKIQSADSGLWTESGVLTTKTKEYVTHINVQKAWKEAVPYLKVGNTWKKCIPYVNVQGTWKKGID